MKVKFDTGQKFNVSFDRDDSFDCDFDGIAKADYTGSYSATPSAIKQTLPTSGKTLAADIIVNPIPSNYGLITWDGSTITVS